VAKKSSPLPDAIGERLFEMSWYSNQDHNYRAIYRYGTSNPRFLRIEVKLNPYAFQSHTIVKLWSGTSWEYVCSVPGEGQKLKHTYSTDRRPSDMDYRAEVIPMLRLAIEITGIARDLAATVKAPRPTEPTE
jgi:hypothetical protein